VVVFIIFCETATFCDHVHVSLKNNYFYAQMYNVRILAIPLKIDILRTPRTILNLMNIILK